MHEGAFFLAVNDSSATWGLPADGPVKRLSTQQPPQSAYPLSVRPRFYDPWTCIDSSTRTRFSLPSGFKCMEFLARHGGKVAYGGMDGSVIIIDYSHLVE